MGQDSKPTPRGANAGLGGWENPLDFIAEDHMREREVCALIDKLVTEASMGAAEVEQVLRFLQDQLPQHLADEEIDLFPLMLKRCEPEDEIEKVINRLHADHGHAIADAPAIVAIIRGVNGAAPCLSQSDCLRMTEFAHQARRHLILENAVILPIARARLTEGDLKTMKQHMLERRDTAPHKEAPEC